MLRFKKVSEIRSIAFQFGWTLVRPRLKASNIWPCEIPVLFFVSCFGGLAPSASRLACLNLSDFQRLSISLPHIGHEKLRFTPLVFIVCSKAVLISALCCVLIMATLAEV